MSRFFQRKYALSRDEAERLDRHPRRDGIIEFVEDFRDRQAEAPNSPAVTGLLLGLLNEGSVEVRDPTTLRFVRVDVENLRAARRRRRNPPGRLMVEEHWSASPSANGRDVCVEIGDSALFLPPGEAREMARDIERSADLVESTNGRPPRRRRY